MPLELLVLLLECRSALLPPALLRDHPEQLRLPPCCGLLRLLKLPPQAASLLLSCLLPGTGCRQLCCQLGSLLLVPGSCLAQLAAQVCRLALKLVRLRCQAGSPLLRPLQCTSRWDMRAGNHCTVFQA